MKAMVLFSGGIDSTTCLGMAVENMVQKMLLHYQYHMDRNIQRDRSIR